jgi:hypothetical protein
MRTFSMLALLAAALTALVNNGCAHAQTPSPAPVVANTGPAPTVAVAQAQVTAPTPPAVSPAAAEVVRLSEAGTSEDILLAYIQNDTAPFDLNADQILYLRDIGVSSPAITAMLSRDNVLRNQPASAEPPPAVQPPPAPAVAVTAPLVPETAPVYASSPPPEVNYFYDELSPYGSWVDLDGVGWCWQPRAVALNRSWTPYCDSGHWVYTDAGWFWQSDYSWGWAPFHYGRWTLSSRCGWVWLPDRVWGPAWVTWRSEGDHCGWAPLPPHADFDVHLGYRFNGVAVAASFDFGLRPNHFTFIAVRDFDNHDYAHHRLPTTEVTKIYNHTTVINNYVVNNNTVINQGIRPEQVRAATHTEVRKVAIHDVAAPSVAVAASRGGARGELAVYRPQLKAPARPVNVVAQKIDQRHPVIQHPPPVATTQQPLVANVERNAANRGNQNSAYNPGRRGAQERPGATASPTQPQNQMRTTGPGSEQHKPATRPGVETPSRPQPTPRTAPNQPSYPLRTAPNTPQNPLAGTPGQSAGAYNPKGYSQPSVEGRGPAAQPRTRPAERGGDNSRDNGNRGQGRRNDQ